MPRIAEPEIYAPIMQLLASKPDRQALMPEMRAHIEATLSPQGDDLQILRNRNDRKFEQRVRNIRSHQKSARNPIAQGLLEPIKGGLRLTDRGYRRIAKLEGEK